MRADFVSLSRRLIRALRESFQLEMDGASEREARIARPFDHGGTSSAKLDMHLHADSTRSYPVTCF